jgi:hypothetical protein
MESDIRMAKDRQGRVRDRKIGKSGVTERW